MVLFETVLRDDEPNNGDDNNCDPEKKPCDGTRFGLLTISDDDEESIVIIVVVVRSVLLLSIFVLDGDVGRPLLLRLLILFVLVVL